MLDNLNKYKIVLASKSPRRKELLAMLDIPFEVKVKDDIKESYPDALPAESVAEYLSLQKGEAYAGAIDEETLVITADTIVILDGKIYGKPATDEEAIDMLMALQSRTHTVATGVTITTADSHRSFSVYTKVRFAPITKEEAAWYVKKFHPLDKAGAYGIQEWIGCAAVEGIDGSFYNVMGLPVHQLYNALKEIW